MKVQKFKISALFALLGVSLLAISLTGLVGGKAIAAEKDFDFSAQTLRVGVWIEGLDEGEVLDRGEEITVGFQTNEDAYAVVYRINAEGLVTILWPRSRMDDGFAFGGHEYLLPVSGARRLVAASSTGEGFIEAIVSRHPFDLRELPLDFHHEFAAENIDFYVTGDPFLAMNEVNFSVTVMEDSQDFVVTNYLSYYVHKQVDHPRYLCDQCHVDENLALNPYTDHCTIDITYDYGWNNDWYADFGYYPVYHNPVYVYVDPWTWRPWVNFWYEPYYVCSPWTGHRWNNPAYVWCDSPYYHSDSVRFKTGRGVFKGERPNQNAHSPRTKTEDYRGVSAQIAQNGPSGRERDAMAQKKRNKREMGRAGLGNKPVTGVAVRGTKPMVRTRPVIEASTGRGSRGGLQIKESSGRKHVSGLGRRKDGRTSAIKNPIRSNPRGNSRPVRSSGLVPVNQSQGGSRPTTLRGQSRSSSPQVGSGTPQRSGNSSDRRIKPVEPRKKGKRIWSSRSGAQSTDRTGRASGRSNGTSGSIRSRNSNSNGTRTAPRKPNQVKSRPQKSSSVGKSSSKSRSGSKTSSSKSSSNKSQSKSGRTKGASRSKR